jgi:hypothetical protein
MLRTTIALLIAACFASAGGAGFSRPVQNDKDDPQAAIRALMLAIYSNDVAAYEKVTVPHPLRSRLSAGGRVNESALQDLKENPGGLQIRQKRPLLFQGKPATATPSGQFPVGTTGLYVVSHRSGPMVVPLVRREDGWKVDLRWWIAMTEMASGREPASGSPDVVIRSLLASMLRLDRTRSARYLTDAKAIDVLFLGAPPYREPSGVLDATVGEMPLVEIGPGEFYPMPIGPVVEGVNDPNRKVIVGHFGPVEMPFVVLKTGADWRVVAQPYFALMNQ